jgi:hypothetical protein
LFNVPCSLVIVRMTHLSPGVVLWDRFQPEVKQSEKKEMVIKMEDEHKVLSIHSLHVPNIL